MRYMTDTQLYKAAANMETVGGHFAAAIARAFYAADSGNRRLLLQAFGDMFEQYSSPRWDLGESSAERRDRLIYETDNG